MLKNWEHFVTLVSQCGYSVFITKQLQQIRHCDIDSTESGRVVQREELGFAEEAMGSVPNLLLPTIILTILPHVSPSVSFSISFVLCKMGTMVSKPWDGGSRRLYILNAIYHWGVVNRNKHNNNSGREKFIVYRSEKSYRSNIVFSKDISSKYRPTFVLYF